MGELSATTRLPAVAAYERELAMLIAIARVEPDVIEQGRISARLNESIDWNALLVLAERHCLEALLYQHLHRYGAERVPVEVLERLGRECKTIAGRSFLLASKLKRISVHLEERGIAHISYKGPLFAECCYGSCALRASNDLDLIVRPSDLGAVREALGEIGFHDQNGLSHEQQEASFRLGFEHPFHGAGGVDLDLHWRVVQRFKSRSLDMDGIWRRVDRAKLFGARILSWTGGS